MSVYPTAALLIIGDEVLSSKVADQNGPFLLQSLRAHGVQVVEMRVVGDRVEAIVEALRALKERATYVFTTGGIGPTHDDVTLAAVALAFGRRVVHHGELLARLHARFGAELSPARARFAEIPEGAHVVLGPEDLVPVISIANVFVFPGVPSLMRACFARVVDTLEGAPFYSAAVFLSASESEIAASLTLVQQAHPEVAIGSYPRFDQASYRVKVTLDARDHHALDRASRDLSAALKPEWVVLPDEGG